MKTNYAIKTNELKFKTTAAYISGGMCGQLWMGGLAGYPTQHDVRAQIKRFSEKAGTTFEDVVSHILMEKGGDFQNAQFTADTVLRVERIAWNGTMKHIHVYERELAVLPGCADYINTEAYVCDFMGYE